MVLNLTQDVNGSNNNIMYNKIICENTRETETSFGQVF